MQDDPSLSTADGTDPTTDGLTPRRRPGPVALCWACLVPLRRVLPRAHLPTTGRLPRMTTAGVTGLRSVDLPKDHLTKDFTAKAVKKIGGPVGTHAPLAPPSTPGPPPPGGPTCARARPTRDPCASGRLPVGPSPRREPTRHGRQTGVHATTSRTCGPGCPDGLVGSP